MSHKEKILDIIKQLKNLKSKNQPVSFSKKTVSHFVPSAHTSREKLPKLDLKSLDSLLNIDPKKNIGIAEPGLTFSELLIESLKYNLIPAVVPELKTITLGGAISGCSIESMSYKYGGFHDSCLEYEIITSNGEIIICSKDNNQDIFDMIHGSYGTLGIISKIKFKLLPAKPYVHLLYKKYNNFEQYWNDLQKYCQEKQFDFIDGIIYNTNLFILCLGNMEDSAPFTSKYDWLKVFYKAAAKKEEDYFKIYDYFYRYDADCHWLSKKIPLMETFFGRLFFGKFILGSSNLIKLSKKFGPKINKGKKPDVVVDVFIPNNNFPQFYNWYKKDFNFFPLWIVPYRAPKIYPWVSNSLASKIEDAFFIDAAIYGKENNEKNIDYAKMLEDKVFELNGIKTLISQNHYSRTRFWEIYNFENFKKVKQKTDPNNLFNDLYKKMVR